LRKDSKWNRPMRLKIAGELGVVWPEEAQILMQHYKRKCSERGLCTLGFRVQGLPKSLNHQYEEGLSFCKPDTPGAFQDRGGRWRVRSYRLRPEVLDWRTLVTEAMGEDRWKWKPTGVTAAMILFESPHWLTARRMVREEDADNKAKPALDAVEQATTVPDELHWQIHIFKVMAKRKRTSIFLFDLSDVVEYYY